MKFKIFLAVLLLSNFSLLAFAQQLNQQQYDQQVNALYSTLLNQQELLNRELDGKKEINKIIQISCDYVENLAGLEKLSLENITLKEAKIEAEHARKLIQDFELSFKDLGTSSAKSCSK